jgi:hypothetical protein
MVMDNHVPSLINKTTYKLNHDTIKNNLTTLKVNTPTLDIINGSNIMFIYTLTSNPQSKNLYKTNYFSLLE